VTGNESYLLLLMRSSVLADGCLCLGDVIQPASLLWLRQKAYLKNWPDGCLRLLNTRA